MLLGNEAIARGALEAGVQVCAGYPGTPSTEIVQSLIESAQAANLYAEWSVNEKVAVEVAAAAAFCGLKSLASMKNAGFNVASDTLMHLNLSGVGKGAMVVVLCDDPQAHASGDEMDTRHVAEIADVPLLEPSNPQEAKDFTKFAFELSERFRTYCIVRSYTRLSHSHGPVVLSSLPEVMRRAEFHVSDLITPYGDGRIPGSAPVQRHSLLHQKMEEIREIFETSQFNFSTGPSNPDLLIICSGSGWPCSVDSIETLGLEDRVGILKLGTLWPYPKKLVAQHLEKVKQVLIVEEVDSLIEGYVKQTLADFVFNHPIKVMGKSSGHLFHYGEVTPDGVINALSSIFNIPQPSQDVAYKRKVQSASEMVIPRALPWCPGCPHRATFYVLNQVFKKVGNEIIVAGDIGCYTIDQWAAGTNRTNLCLCMGSSLGLASGLGKLERFGLEKRVVAICGDSTFFHASIPGLINAVVNRSKMTLIILDNDATAMTGFQPHPGTGKTAMGEKTIQLRLEDIARACGVSVVEVFDPFNILEARKIIENILSMDGPSVLIARRACALLAQRERNKRGETTAPFRISEKKCSKYVSSNSDKLMPCASSCPAGNEIPEFLHFARQGKFQEGFEILRRRNPFPAVLGRVCYHPCEELCGRNSYDEAIVIHEIEKFLGDYGGKLPLKKRKMKTFNEKIAVIGSGPAGLSCAYNLALMGYQPIVFERLSVAGGMLAVGIPEYRLPRQVLESEIRQIEEMGVQIRLGSHMLSTEELIPKKFDAIFIATGAHKDLKLQIPGEDKEGVLPAIEFLRNVNLKKSVTIGNRVIVVGGGNAAIDSARAAIRLGAKSATIIYRRSRADMPAHEEDILAAMDEGVEIQYLVFPQEILGTKRLSKVRCVRMKLGKPDESGRPLPIPLENSTFDIEADTVIVAVGQTPDFTDNLPVSKTNALLINDATLSVVGKPGFFAGGDVVTGPSYVADAIGAGIRGAISMDAYLRGKPLPGTQKKNRIISYEALNLGSIPFSPRVRGLRLFPEKRILDFSEIESVFSSDEAVYEASRCFSCGPSCEKCITGFHCPAFLRDVEGRHEIVDFLCVGCGACVNLCPYRAIVDEEIS